MVEEIGGAAATIARIYRYPVKGLSADPLQRISLAAGWCLPQDRRFAIEKPGVARCEHGHGISGASGSRRRH